jgi:hypothetical protein
MQRRTQSLRIAPCATNVPKVCVLVGFGIEDFSKNKVPRCGAPGELYFSRGLEAETTPGYRGGAFESEDAVVADPGAFADSPPTVEFDVRSRLTDSFCCKNSYFPS